MGTADTELRAWDLLHFVGDTKTAIDTKTLRGTRSVFNVPVVKMTIDH